MPVPAECTSVLIRNGTVESRLPGGMAEFESNCPNATFCTDGVICSVRFMDPRDALAYMMAPPAPSGARRAPIWALLGGARGSPSGLHVARARSAWVMIKMAAAATTATRRMARRGRGSDMMGLLTLKFSVL
jgi:hypothetical protein